MALIVAWIVYAIFGWVFAAIGCLLYNWAAGFTGGIEFELTQAPPPGYGQSGPAWGAPPPGAWQYGPSWGANPPTQGQPWTPPPGTPWGPNPPPARPGPAWPVPPQGPGEQSWGGPPDQR